MPSYFNYFICDLNPYIPIPMQKVLPCPYLAACQKNSKKSMWRLYNTLTMHEELCDCGFNATLKHFHRCCFLDTGLQEHATTPSWQKLSFSNISKHSYIHSITCYLCNIYKSEKVVKQLWTLDFTTACYHYTSITYLLVVDFYWRSSYHLWD